MTQNTRSATEAAAEAEQEIVEEFMLRELTQQYLSFLDLLLRSPGASPGHVRIIACQCCSGVLAALLDPVSPHAMCSALNPALCPSHADCFAVTLVISMPCHSWLSAIEFAPNWFFTRFQEPQTAWFSCRQTVRLTECNHLLYTRSYVRVSKATCKLPCSYVSQLLSRALHETVLGTVVCCRMGPKDTSESSGA